MEGEEEEGEATFVVIIWRLKYYILLKLKSQGVEN